MRVFLISLDETVWTSIEKAENQTTKEWSERIH